ncbi:protein kinase family protein [Leptospira meyeri]|uniref:protein kinase family protein n=1 Tax=Leptospira meyeri TaxID=29508 RepID=UPI0002BD8137|nr:protein kinase family protein [Leptospira meyeri]EMJ87261.1 kinase domain protein [Leptospira meyeri serovar Semaranga str. Veldrot Semarang 173]
MENQIIKFIRQKDFENIKEIGQGGLGKTILLRDPEINELFVCKKYAPYVDNIKEEFYENFKNEIKLMYQLYHKNIVRIFNYHLYPEHTTGYILMEYIDGTTITEYLSNHPEKIENIFEQTIAAFAYLESNQILHRDIRNNNILVTHEGVVKVIDLGFGKKIFDNNDFDKSISLNWWCQTPNEFNDKIYNFSTEVYFIGMLFKEIIDLNSISFKNTNLLNSMIEVDYNKRIKSFFDIQNTVISDEVDITDLFNSDQKNTYKEFANALSNRISTINTDIRFPRDHKAMIKDLSKLYKIHMLEEEVLDVNSIISIFITAGYTYYKSKTMPIYALKDFLDLLKACDEKMATIVILNLQNRLRMIERKIESDNQESDDIPF